LKLQRLIGLSGVEDHESKAALFCSRLLELPMIFAAFWIATTWFASSQDPDFDYPRSYDLALWCLFSLETALMSLLVHNKISYLRHNWLNLIIILMGLPLLWGLPSYFGALRLLRLLLLFSLLLHIGTSIRQLLQKNSLGPTLLGSAIIIVMSGLMMAAIDPGILTVEDGIWWALVTVTTVGYGDIVPTSGVGRVFGAALILIGLGLFSLLTASLTAIFISQEEPPNNQDTAIVDKMLAIEEQIAKLDDKIDQVIQQNREN